MEQIPIHYHDGRDSNRIYYNDLFQKKLQFCHTIVGTMAATAANYGVFFIAPAACYLSKFQEVHKVAGSDGSAVTITLEKLTSTVAPDSGTVMLTTALSLKSTINIVQSGILATSLATLNLAAGDRLCLKDVGTLTDVANVTVLVELTLV